MTYTEYQGTHFYMLNNIFSNMQDTIVINYLRHMYKEKSMLEIFVYKIERVNYNQTV